VHSYLFAVSYLHFLHCFRLSGRNLHGVPSRDSNPASKPARYLLSYAVHLLCQSAESTAGDADHLGWIYPHHSIIQGMGGGGGGGFVLAVYSSVASLEWLKGTVA
jgi:hypothetical protein